MFFIINIILGCSHIKRVLGDDDILEGEDIEGEMEAPLEWNGLISQASDGPRTALYPYQKSPSWLLLHTQTKREPSKMLLDPRSSHYFLLSSYPQFLNSLDNLKPFFGGFIGLRGNARIFAIENSPTPQKFEELFPVIIQVLSKEYGCFIKKKISWTDQHQFFCRDKRNIVVWYQPVLGWSRIVFRQFDHFGYEIKVRHKEIHRISLRQILNHPLKPDMMKLAH